MRRHLVSCLSTILRAESGSTSRAARFCGAMALLEVSVDSCAGRIELSGSVGKLGMARPPEPRPAVPTARAGRMAVVAGGCARQLTRRTRRRVGM